MSTERILMEIHASIGRHGALLETISEDVKETKKQATATNGRVIGLEQREEHYVTKKDLQAELMQLRTTPTPQKESKWWSLDWQKMILFFGSLATIAALTIQQLLSN